MDHNLARRCNVDSKVTRVAWLNRTTILFAGNEKWSLDPRVVLMENTAVTEYSIKIQNVDIHDEGPYVCSILTNRKPKSTKVHLIVQEMEIGVGPGTQRRTLEANINQSGDLVN
ncbi:opioid-binding cell adhesion molecule-like isoform X1 [Solea senegalensis]|uniref:Opioid-binding cell adhesion molecule-like isoform X1 n=1 Tax=Solea senegalensis TaxID=28829 RepID=A0AAV6QKI1_SOLSE|nr:opioid-binding cell adhesion molecule-like isoform X1 [Solea senegalensis]